MTTINTFPSPIIINSPATLDYTKYSLIPIPNDIYVLRQSGTSTSVSNTYTSGSPTLFTIAPNYYNGYSTSSCCLYVNGIIYTSFATSNISGNGFIQQTIDVSSSVYLQFNNGASPPIPSNFYSPQYPTGLVLDTNGYLYFLVFGDNNIYRITDLNNPQNFVKYNTNSSVISAPFAMAINLNTNYMYVTATNLPYYIEQIDTTQTASILSGYTGTQPSYGICCDTTNNLYIGYSNGVIGKFNLNTSTFTSNFLTLTGEGIIYGMTYVPNANAIIANVGTVGNVYLIPLNNTSLYQLLISNSGIYGTFGNNGIDTIYGTNTTSIISYKFNKTFSFNNVLLQNTSNTLDVYNTSLNSVASTFTINAITSSTNPQTYFTTPNGSGIVQDLSGIFQPLALGTAYPYATGYKIPDGRDFNQIFANISSGLSLGYNVNYQFNGNDLSQIFARYDPILPILDLDSQYYSSGNTWTNYGTGGNTYDVTLYNSPTFTSAGTSSYFTLNGTSQYFSGNVPVRDDFTWNVWFKTTSSGGSSAANGRNQFGATNPQWYNGLQLIGGDRAQINNDYGLSIGQGNLMFGIGQVYLNDWTVKSPLTYNDGKWYMVTATRNKTSGVIELYVDGVFINSVATVDYVTLDSVPIMYYGCQFYNQYQLSAFFPGSISIIQAFDSVLTSAQIIDIYNNQKNRYPN